LRRNQVVDGVLDCEVCRKLIFFKECHIVIFDTVYALIIKLTVSYQSSQEGDKNMYPGRAIPRPRNKTISPAGGSSGRPADFVPAATSRFFDILDVVPPETDLAPLEPGVEERTTRWPSRFKTDLAPGETRSLQINPNNDGLIDGMDAILLTVDGSNPAVGFSQEIYILKESDDQRQSLPGNSFQAFADRNLTLIDSEVPQLVYGSLFSEAVVLIEDAQASSPLQLGDGNDIRSGSNGIDIVYAGGGDDNLSGSGSDDIIRGQTGNDILQGDDGDDILLGEAGNDLFRGSNGDDYLSGGSGNDTFYGDAGDDEIDGMMGDDTLVGGAGNDALRGGTGADRFNFYNPSLEGTDIIEDFNVATDKIGIYVGNTGSGFTNSGLTADAPIAATQFHTGENAASASDRFIYDTTTGKLFFDSDGTGAIAQMQVARLSPGLTLSNLNMLAFGDPQPSQPQPSQPQPSQPQPSQPSQPQPPIPRDPQQLTNGNDIFTGSPFNDTLLGLGGNDILNGGAGNDTLFGNAGKDILSGGEGRDRLVGGAGNDTLSGGIAQSQTIPIGLDQGSAMLENDTMVGGRGHDIFELRVTRGRDAVQDFKDHQDRLRLRPKLSFQDLTIVQRGRNAVISLNSDPLAILRDVQASQITRADFVSPLSLSPLNTL
jgi:Ca2+-binding RTX toxin-like protein